MKVNQLLILGALIICSLFETAMYGASYWGMPADAGYWAAPASVPASNGYWGMPAGAGYWAAPDYDDTNESYGAGYWGMPADSNLNNLNLGGSALDDDDVNLNNLNYQNSDLESIYDLDALLAAADADNR